MKKVTETNKPVEVNKIIEYFSTKYYNLIYFLSPLEIELLVQKAISMVIVSDTLNSYLDINILVEKLFFLKVKEEIELGNIDLEISVVEKYLPITQFMLRQLKYLKEDANQKAEEAIMDSIENYDGKEIFKISILKSIKKSLNSNKKDSLISNDELKETSYIKNEEVNSKFNNAQNTFTKNNLILPKDGIARKPNQLDLLIRSLDILHQVSLDDEVYLKFLALKYGYYDEQYFDLEEIANILSISISESKKYYFQSLEYIKNWFGLQLDNMYTYYLKSNN